LFALPLIQLSRLVCTQAFLQPEFSMPDIVTDFRCYPRYLIEHVVSDHLRSSEAPRPLEQMLRMHHLERDQATPSF
jgi:hypothetical protein